MPVDGIRAWLACICLLGAAVSTVAWAIAVVKLRTGNGEWGTGRGKEQIRHSTFSILHSKFSLHTAVFVFFAAIATLSAQKTNSPPRMMMGHPLAMQQVLTVSPNDVSRGFRLESETSASAHSYAMPTNGVRYDKWWKRGAFEDVFRLDLGGMPFPLADELLSSLWVYSWGMAGAHLGNTTRRLVATGVPMSAVPGLSQFWSADSPVGSKLLTWQNFALNRDTNTHMINVELKM